MTSVLAVHIFRAWLRTNALGIVPVTLDARRSNRLESLQSGRSFGETPVRNLPMQKQVGFVLSLALAVAPFRAFAERPVGQKSTAAVSFSLKDVAGHEVALSDFRDKRAVVLVFIGTECPVSNYYVLRLKELHGKYAPKGVQFLAVNSNPQDSAQDAADHAKREGIPF